MARVLLAKSASMRERAGSILLMTVALVYIFVVLVVALFSISMIISGTRQFRDTVDSGALSMIKNAMLEPSLTVKRGEDPYEVLTPLLEPYDGVTIKNMNRLTAAALLVEVNEAAMEEERSSTPDSKRDAMELINTVEDLARRFSQSLRDKRTRIKAFEDITGVNSINMLGPEAAVRPALVEWQPAFVNEGEATNIKFDYKQVPDGARARIPLKVVEIKGKRDTYIAGYTEINTGVDPLVRRSGQSFFYPLRPPLKPHLIDEQSFQKNQNEPRGLANRTCIPNAFSAKALAKLSSNDSKPMTFESFAIAEGMDEGYNASIPAGFVRVENNSGKTIKLEDLMSDRKMKDLKKRIQQRIYEVDPEISENAFERLLEKRLFPRDRYIITTPEARRLLSPKAELQSPDGSGVPPVEVETCQCRWTPSTGHNNVLGVLTIEPLEPR
ncbi:MAG: hypothetical protein K2W95_22195 [Candidatus Obscuribacterales bacterium]|nr:hypothetical protein [Candidatus Obscuribacterales bacterium]